MTLFITIPGRRYEISDAYVMALSFCISFAIARIIKTVLKKLKKREIAKDVKIPNLKGGGMEIEFIDDNELASIILTCIADNELYVVKNPKIVELVFGLVKEKIKNESLIMTPNMMRFLALKLLSNDDSLIIRFGRIISSSDSRVRLFSRALGSFILGFVGGLFSIFPYALLVGVLYFDCTENCGHKCREHFEHIPKERPAIIYAEKLTGNLVIGQNDPGRQVIIYIPSKLPDEVIIRNTKEVTIKKSYTHSRKQAKEVKFSDFRKKDPILSSFDNLEEPRVPQEPYLINDLHDVIGIE
jgi:hypothetical protein